MKLYEKFKLLDKFTQLSIIAILLGILLRFLIVFFVYPSGDSTWHLSAARFIAENNQIPMFEGLGRSVFWAPPIFHFTAALLYKIFSVFGYDIAMKSMDFATFIYGSLSLIFFYLLASHFMTKKRSFYSTIFFTFIPINIYYSTISHVESTISFFALLSVYLLVKKRFYLAAFFSGIGCLSKYSMFWMFPLFVYIIFKDNFTKTTNQIKSFGKFVWKLIVFFFIAFIIGLPWYMRNLINLGNPVYHFLNGIFIRLGLHPYLSDVMINMPDYNLFKADYFVKAYLDLFGVPLGLPSNLFSLKLPLMPLPVIGWLALTAVFFIPIIFGLFKIPKGELRNIIWIWFASFFAMVIVYLIPEHQMFLRLFLPALPALAIMWGFGTEKIFSFKMNHIVKSSFIVLILVCIAMFSFGEIVKANIGASQYKSYESDFKWVSENTLKDAVFYPYSIVLVYYLHREVAVNYTNADYYFESGLTGKREKVPEEELKLNFIKLYENEETKVKIYRHI